MKGINTEQYAVHPYFKETIDKIISKWNSIHHEQVAKQKPLSKKRFSLALAKFLQQPSIFNTLTNMEVTDLDKT